MIQKVKILTVIIIVVKRRDESSGEDGVSVGNALDTRTYPQTPLISNLLTQTYTPNAIVNARKSLIPIQI